jgi:hypothetical protein
VSDLHNQPEDGESKTEQKPREGPTVTIEGDPTVLLNALQGPTGIVGAKAQMEAATRLGEAAKVATGALGSSISASAMKSFNDVTKNMFGSSGIAEAMKSVNVARGILGKLDMPKSMLPERQTLSADVMRWHAEKEAAPVAPRDAVWALADAVESLAESQRRADEWQRSDAEARRRATNLQIKISVASLVLAALLVLKEFL